MVKIYGLKNLNKPEDWEESVKKKNFKPEKSAYELAYKWGRKNQKSFPTEIRKVFKSSNVQILQSIKPIKYIVEKPVTLDTGKSSSYNDIMVYCRTEEEESIVIAVEGKVEEKFDSIVSIWLKKGDSERSKENRLKRLAFLCGLLGISMDQSSNLRYQLLHRTASAILEARKMGSIAAIVLIHSFGSKTKSNYEDYKTFIKVVGVEIIKDSPCQGPVLIGEGSDTISTYFLWVNDECHQIKK